MEDQRAEEAWFENEWRSGRNPSDYGECPISIPKPTPYNFQYPAFCGCGIQMPKKYKEDCYFYCEEHQMGATIPYCSYHNGGLGYCPCDNCDKFISRADVYKSAKDMVNRNDQ